MSDTKADFVSHVEDNHSGGGHSEKVVVGHSAKHVAGDALLLDSQGNVRNLPIPSNDPNDPLNFSLREKATVVFSCCWFCKFRSGPVGLFLTQQPSVWTVADYLTFLFSSTP